MSALQGRVGGHQSLSIRGEGEIQCPPEGMIELVKVASGRDVPYVGNPIACSRRRGSDLRTVWAESGEVGGCLGQIGDESGQRRKLLAGLNVPHLRLLADREQLRPTR